MVNVSMEIKTTRDIARQILRHRSFTFQEFSQRYADPTKDLGFVTREARLQDKKNRQASIEVDDDALQQEWEFMQTTVRASSMNAYNWAIANGIAKEQARAVLPEGLTESVMIVSGSLRSWVHYCDLRMKWDTQKEHRIVAEQCWNVIEEAFPDIKIALDNLND
jgi:thymidylate synthase (FAD)